MPNSPQDPAIETKLYTIIGSAIAENFKKAGLDSTYLPNVPTIQKATKSVSQLINEAKVEAQIEELGHIRLEYGHYLASTFAGMGNNKEQTIMERINQLKALRERSE